MIKFFKSAKRYNDPAEQRLAQMIDMIKDLPRPEYTRLKAAMDLGYSAYQKIKNVKTEEKKAIEEELSKDKTIDSTDDVAEVEE